MAKGHPSVPAGAWVALAVIAALVAPASAQTPQPGAIGGRVVDPSGLPLPGVLVAVQGAAPSDRRQAMTQPDGSYAVPQLPPGDYTVTFVLAGFRRQQQGAHVDAAGTTMLNVELVLAAFPTSVTVTTEAVRDQPAQTTPEGTVMSPSSLELLPHTGLETAIVTMAPGVTPNGPNNAITISGGLSYANLFLLDGFVINENLRGQARPFLIGEAMQETRIATSGIAAEYGRFQGGVVNTITRSGTNVFGGSVRATFANDRWRALTPFPGDRTINRSTPAVQATAGGPLKRNRLWFFAAASYDEAEQNRTLPYTGFAYTSRQEDARFEGKLTWAVTPRQTARFAYYRIDSRRTRANTGTVMDTASLYDTRSPEALVGVVYSAVLKPRLFVEAQYSNRQLTFEDVGSRDTTLQGGTPIWDRSRADARFNSPTGCAVCAGSADERDNQDATLKLFYVPQAGRTGSHEIAGGLDAFQESRSNNSYQSGSGFSVRATRSNIVNSNVFPVFLSDRTTWIYWTPILSPSKGNDLRTYSAFVSDTWRPIRSLGARLGIRYDRADDRDSVASQVVRGGTFSPRVSVTWNVRSNGRLTLNAGVARYVTSVATNIADAASPGGRPATYVYDYLGPAVNADPKSAQITSAAALKILFDWFNANGGTARATRSAPSIPGVTSRIDPGLVPPDAHEIVVGATLLIGKSGSFRVDGIRRTFGDFYANRRDMSTGRTTDSTGRQYDLLIVTNTNRVRREYWGINAQYAGSAGAHIQLTAAYTLSWTRGSYDGESSSVGPDASVYTDYPEYRDPAWNSPYGWLSSDQRHKLRATATWDMPVPSRLGRFALGVVERVDSGRPWSAIGSINPSAYVVNPGYLTPPTSVTYYFSARGAYRTDTIASTDLALNWTWRVPRTTRTQLVGRLFLTNVFNSAGIVNVARTILTRNDSTVYQAFNPFTTLPVLGVNYGYGASYGQPTTPGDYQAPRAFTCSFGFRF